MSSLKVLSTNAVSSALTGLIPRFEAENNRTVSISYCNSKTITSRVSSGENADIAIATDSCIDELSSQGKIRPGSRTSLATTALGLVVKAGAVRPPLDSAESLRRLLLSARSVACSATGASGMEFPGILRELGILGQMKDKLRVIKSGPVANAVARGEADLGFQLISELVGHPGVDLIGPIPFPLQRFTPFTAAILTASKQTDTASAFITFLTTPAAASTFEATGLSPFPRDVRRD